MTATIDPNVTMRELLAQYPGAQRALFRSYHIGGCSSCGFQPEETLAALCARNENLPVAEVAQTILSAHDSDQKMQISPAEAAELLKAGKAKIVDVRSREEFDAVRIEGSEFLTQELMHELGSWPREQTIIFVCHHGIRSLDAASYFIGHGIENARSLTGGIDAWSCEIDPAVSRYELE
ncbi:MAG: rhodanese-like domain-containing protein [Chthoniobacteraceae bacterium]